MYKSKLSKKQHSLIKNLKRDLNVHFKEDGWDLNIHTYLWEIIEDTQGYDFMFELDKALFNGKYHTLRVQKVNDQLFTSLAKRDDAKPNKKRKKK